MQFSAKELGHLVQGTVYGDATTNISGFAPLDQATEGDISFLSNPKYLEAAQHTKAGILLIGKKDYPIENQSISAFIVVDDAYLALAQLMQWYQSFQKKELKGIHPTAVVHKSASIDASAYIGPFVSIGEGCVIGEKVTIHSHNTLLDGVHVGDGSVLYPNVTVYKDCIIGKRCILHSGAVIGSDGFGFAPDGKGGYFKIPQMGNVVLEHDVEIGANTVIDRATMGRTLIASGSKIDNLVQIAHNVVIGEGTVVASQAGISGSAQLGKNCMIGGQAGFVGHISLADGTKVNAQSGVSKSVTKPNQSLTGSPARPFREHYKQLARLAQLEELINRIEKLEETSK